MALLAAIGPVTLVAPAVLTAPFTAIASAAPTTGSAPVTACSIACLHPVLLVELQEYLSHDVRDLTDMAASSIILF